MEDLFVLFVDSLDHASAYPKETSHVFINIESIDATV